MVVPFPDHGMRALRAVLASHRRLLRMTAEDNRRRCRVEPTFEIASYAPRLAAIPIGSYLGRRKPALAAGAMSVR